MPVGLGVEQYCASASDPLLTLTVVVNFDGGAGTDSIPTNRTSYRVKLKSPAVWACLGVYPLDMPKTPYRASEGKHSQ